MTSSLEIETIKDKIDQLRLALLSKDHRLQVVVYGPVGSGRGQFITHLLAGLYSGDTKPKDKLAWELNECCKVEFYSQVKSLQDQLIKRISHLPPELQKYAQVHINTLNNIPERFENSQLDIIIMEEHYPQKEVGLYQEIKMSLLKNSYVQHIIYQFASKPPRELVMQSDVVINLSCDEVFENFRLPDPNFDLQEWLDSVKG